MKRKLLNLLVALLLGVGLSLIPAVAMGDGTSTYAAYRLGAVTNSTATWTTDNHIGAYSANLTKTGGAGSTYVDFAVSGGTALSSLASIADTFGFWYFMESDKSSGPQLELRFTAATCAK